MKRHSAINRILGAATWLALACLVLANAPVRAQGANKLEAVDVQSLPGQQLQLTMRLSGPAAEPLSFTIDNPARISFDLPGTALGLDSRRQDVNSGPVTTVLAAEANGRTRIVLNLNEVVPYQTRVEGDSVYVTIGQAPGAAANKAAAVSGRYGERAASERERGEGNRRE